MWKHNLKITLRGIINDKGYSLVNIVGLATAVACSFLFLFWVKFELSYERDYTKGDRIYRLMDMEQRSNGPAYTLWLSYPIRGLQNAFPQIESVARTDIISNSPVMVYGQDENISFNINWIDTDEDFLRMFSYEYVEGSPKAVARTRGAIISDETARKLFGNNPAVGKVISIRYMPMAVAAVVKVPRNTELQFDVLTITKTGDAPGTMNFIMLKKGVKLSSDMQKGLEEYPSTVPRSYSRTSIHAEKSLLIAQPIYQTHLHSPEGLLVNLSKVYTDGGDIGQLYIFSIVALLILFIAIINYVNTSIARSLSRMKEVGIRKVSGANKMQLIWRFLFESFFMTFIAVILSLVIVKVFFPYFSGVMGNRISLMFDLSTILIAVAVCLLVAVLAGGYAAFYLSNFSPAHILRGGSSSGSKERLRKTLLGIQFFLAISILICTSVVYKQINYIFTKDTGISRENVLSINTGYWLAVDSYVEVIKNENPSILEASVAYFPPYLITRGYTGVSWEGSPDEIKNVEFGQIYSDHNYANTFGLQLLEGEFLPPGRGRSASQVMNEQGYREVVINETFKKLIGQDNVIGMSITNEGGRALIVGVVKDFNFKPFKEPIIPLMMSYEPNAHFNVYVKTTGKNNQAVFDYLVSKYKEMNPNAANREVKYETVEEEYRSLHASELRTGTMMGMLSGIALFLSLLGVISMVSFMLEKRTREIAIRKINGAEVSDIIRLFSIGIVKVALVATVISISICYVVMSRWLEVYIYRTTLSWWLFALVPAIIIMITIMVIAIQVYFTARHNPVDSLKSE